MPTRPAPDDPRIDVLVTALAERHPRVTGSPGAARAAAAAVSLARASVALVVRPEQAELELLVIKRAARSGDPWSGHMAFPGGRSSPADRSARETAERETREEVGLDLANDGRLLGRLAEVWPRAGAPGILVAPFVFAVPPGAATTLNREVHSAYWIGLSHLSAPGAATEYLHALASGEELRFPAIAYESHVIWGLTHRIMTDFLRTVRMAITAEEEEM